MEEFSASRLLSADVHQERLVSDGVSEPLATASRTLLEAEVEVGLWEAGPAPTPTWR